MALAVPFVPHKPIAHQGGPEVSVVTRENLEHIRNMVISGLAPNWNFINPGTAYGGTYEQPSHLVWQNAVTKEWIYCLYTWDSEGQPATLTWKHRTDNSNSWKLIGVETLLWTVNGNLLSSTWSGAPTYVDPFNKAVPVTSQYAITAVDSIRKNLMALYDDTAVSLGDHWNYTAVIGGGTEEEPTYIFFQKDTDTLRGTITWLNGSPSVISWEYDGGSGYASLGVQTMTFSDGWTSSYAWTTGSGYTKFASGVPTGEETDGDDTLDKIREQLIALSHGAAIGILPGWSFFWSADPEEPESSTIDLPEALVYFNAPEAVIVVNTYGTTGPAKNCPTKQSLWYSNNGGFSYDKTYTVSYDYTDGGIIFRAVWEGTAAIDLEDAKLDEDPIAGGVWDDDVIWSDSYIWVDA